MKILTFLFLIPAFNSVYAQNKPKADSAFYLLDTSKTLPSDKLWHTYKMGSFKLYELEIYAPYIELMNTPAFAYSSRYQQPVNLSNDQFKSIKTSSLSELIHKLKLFVTEDNGIKPEAKKPFYLYIIEPRRGGYSMVKTQLDGSGPQKIVY